MPRGQIWGEDGEHLGSDKAGAAPYEYDPDWKLKRLLPPLHKKPVWKAHSMIEECLVNNGIPVFRRQENPNDDPLFRKACQHQLHSWTVKWDGSVHEGTNTDYEWTPVEVTSPAAFAIDEAFDMVRLVVHLITSNFRCRVNKSCGYHVHIGNGRSRIDLDTARNFAALWWAAEPIITMLHPTERAFETYSMSSRRTRQSALANGDTARDVWRDCREDTDKRGMLLDLPGAEDSPVRARYHGRGRAVGERPEPERLPDLEGEKGYYYSGDGLPRSRLAPGWEDEADDVDWKAEDGEPFRRPKVHRHCHPPASNMPAHQHGTQKSSLKRGPPGIAADMKLETGTAAQKQQGTSAPGQGPPGSKLGLQRPRSPPFRRRTARSYKPRSIECMSDEGPADRLGHPRNLPGAVNADRPRRTDVWSGVQEILACDIGIHQVACLMGTHEKGASNASKYMSLNWSAFMPRGVSRGIARGVADPSSAERESQRSPYEFSFDIETIDPYSDTARLTLESREAQGTLDAEWIVVWARILCGLLEWSRDTSATELLRVVGLCDRPEEYNVVDLLQDLGLYAEAEYCEGRLQRLEEAWFDCMLLDARFSDADYGLYDDEWEYDKTEYDYTHDEDYEMDPSLIADEGEEDTTGWSSSSMATDSPTSSWTDQPEKARPKIATAEVPYEDPTYWSGGEDGLWY